MTPASMAVRISPMNDCASNLNFWNRYSNLVGPKSFFNARIASSRILGEVSHRPSIDY
jgi:hypothetical protein